MNSFRCRGCCRWYCRRDLATAGLGEVIHDEDSLGGGEGTNGLANLHCKVSIISQQDSTRNRIVRTIANEIFFTALRPQCRGLPEDSAHDLATAGLGEVIHNEDGLGGGEGTNGLANLHCLSAR
jgi:hypothetical protein